MRDFFVGETEDGMTVAEVPAGETPENVAVRLSRVIADPGPYRSYEEAQDAMLLIPQEEEEVEPPDG